MAKLVCVFCHHALDTQGLSGAVGEVSCRNCGRLSTVAVFPSLLDDIKPPPLLSLPPQEGEAACFYNPARRATKECQHCGVLVSDQWAAQWGSQTVCLKCLDHLREKSQDARFETQRTMWDNIALTLALVPCTVFLAMLAFITAPAAVFIALWHWKSPRSLVPRSKFRLVCAIVLGLIQIGAGLTMILNSWFHWF